MASDGQWYPPQTHPSYRPPPPEGAPLGRRPELEPLSVPTAVALVAAAVVSLGCFLPWEGSESGMQHGLGTFVLVGAALMAVAAWLRWHEAWVWSLGVVGLATMAVQSVRVLGGGDGVGFGLVLVVAAWVVTIVAGLQLRELRAVHRRSR